MDIGERIKAIRESKNIKQKDLAARLNVTPSMISQYENGFRKPKGSTIAKIAEALECKASDLVNNGFYYDGQDFNFFFKRFNFCFIIFFFFGFRTLFFLSDILYPIFLKIY